MQPARSRTYRASVISSGLALPELSLTACHISGVGDGS